MSLAIPPQGLPLLIAAEDVIPTTKRIIADLWAVRDDVVWRVQPFEARFANVVTPLIEAENRTSGKIAVIAMLRYASPDKAARDASEAAVQLLSEASAKFTAREDIYLLLKAVKYSAALRAIRANITLIFD